MAKITVSRLFEISQYLATQSGQQLQGALTYLSEFAEVALRNLRNGLTFRDNFDCSLKTIQLVTATETVLDLSVNKTVKAIFVYQVIDSTYYIVNQFGWKYNSRGQLVIFANFVNTVGSSPNATTPISIALLAFFG